MIPFVYGQSVIYYNKGTSPVPNWIYGQSVLNYEYVASGNSVVPVIIQLLSQHGV